LDGQLCGVSPDGITSFSIVQLASDSGLDRLVRRLGGHRAPSPALNFESVIAELARRSASTMASPPAGTELFPAGASDILPPPAASQQQTACYSWLSRKSGTAAMAAKGTAGAKSTKLANP